MRDFHYDRPLSSHSQILSSYVRSTTPAAKDKEKLGTMHIILFTYIFIWNSEIIALLLMFIIIWLYNVHITRVAWTVTCPPPISMTSHVTWESRRFAQSNIKLHLGTCNVFHLTNKQTKMDSLSCTTVENDALHFSFLTFKNSSQQLCHRNSDTQFGNNCDHFKSYKFFKSNNIYTCFMSIIFAGISSLYPTSYPNSLTT